MPLPSFFTSLLNRRNTNLSSAGKANLFSGISPLKNPFEDGGELTAKKLGPLGKFRKNFADNAAFVGPALAQIFTATDSSQIQGALQNLVAQRENFLSRQFEQSEREKDRTEARESRKEVADLERELQGARIGSEEKLQGKRLAAEAALQTERLEATRENLDLELGSRNDLARADFNNRMDLLGIEGDQRASLFQRELQAQYTQTFLPLTASVNPITGENILDVGEVSSISRALAAGDTSSLDPVTLEKVGASFAIQQILDKQGDNNDLFKLGLELLSKPPERAILDPTTGEAIINPITGKPQTVPIPLDEWAGTVTGIYEANGVPLNFGGTGLTSPPPTDSSGNTEQDILLIENVKLGAELAKDNDTITALNNAESDLEVKTIARHLMANGLGLEGLISFAQNLDIDIKKKRAIFELVAQLQEGNIESSAKNLGFMDATPLGLGKNTLDTFLGR